MCFFNDFHEEGSTMKYELFLVATVLLPLVHCQKFTQIVDTDKGQVRGRIFDTAWHSMSYSAFLGIPFAEPPVGDLRFRDPVEANSWNGVLNATEEAPACLQYLAIRPVGKEDCLYLNVYTPVLDFADTKTLKPVMVWIYGGAFITGMIWQKIYGPDYLLEEDMVVVAMNYRLGPFGSMALGLPDARGNQALKDQNLALQWVQKNIAKFGGDPNRVTIFGESAGAVSVTYHLLSPKSKGLFHQAISQSGSALCSWSYHTPAQAAKIAHEVGERVGITALTNQQLLNSLKQADAVDIAYAGFTMINLELPLPIGVPFSPTVDVIPSDPSPEQVFLDECPISKFESGNYTRVPIILGYNKEEGILFTIALELVRQIVFDILHQISLHDITGLSRGVIDLLNEGAKGIISKLIKITTIYYFSQPIDITQKYLAEHNGDKPVYYYRLSYATEHSLHKVYNYEINGTAHADDLALEFYTGLFSFIDPNHPYSIYRQKFVSMWTNFAKFGNPTPNNQPINGDVWLPSGKAGLQLDIGNQEFRMRDRLLSETAEGLEPVFTNLLKFQSECLDE